MEPTPASERISTFTLTSRSGLAENFSVLRG
jgi:hypothetical protein